ncbi:hypothetical protein GRI69_07985 [Erythrobacter vulgaris]|uniref:Cadherin domain-containing protein n=1 Tax=Qipengyuania vulgaris TaxID=291985 RepID=A0A844XT62_9SPHN|nr:hypothetical protein [Qipengyuania vulgaris]MXO48192.1 hypothetical protein [Qipengyuania vulgaris]
MSSQSSSALAVILACSLAACGGGGGGGSPAPSPTNRAPTLTPSSTTVTVAENSTGTLFTLSASDPDGDPVNLSLTGADAAFFTLGAGGAVTFTAAPNYDRFADDDSDNDYVVVAQASDGRGGTVRRTLTVTVANQREGFRVTRIASGFVEPAGMSLLFGRTLLVAERAGQIHSVDGRDGTTTDYRTVALPAGGAVLDIASETLGASPFFPVVLFSEPAGMSLRFNINEGSTQDVRVATGAPEGAAGKIAYNFRADFDQGEVLVAVGDPTGNRVGGASGYGNLSSVSRPEASQSSTVRVIGRGVRQPGGWISQQGFIPFFADQGGSVAHELNSIETSPPASFGWPFLEGTTRLMAGGPSATVSPSFIYEFGNGALQGLGIVAGVISLGNGVPGLDGDFVFGDLNGTIWTLDRNFGVSSFENRSADFIPDVGEIGEVVKIIIDDADAIYILDADGELFRVDAA